MNRFVFLVLCVVWTTISFAADTQVNVADIPVTTITGLATGVTYT